MRDVQGALRDLNARGLLNRNGRQTMTFQFEPRKDYVHFVFMTNLDYPSRKLHELEKILKKNGFARSREDPSFAKQNLNEGTGVYAVGDGEIAAHKRIYYSALRDEKDFKAVSTLLEVMKRAEDAAARADIAERVVKHLLGIHED